VTFTYVPGRGDLDACRLIIGDTDEDHVLFSDAEISTFLAMESNDVRYAAAAALDSIASSQARILKVTRLMDLSVDGVAVAKALREHAKQLRADSDGDGAFEIAQQVFTPSGRRQALWNQALREQV
jgi:hypothetical protein